jgi:ABC-2 type transport system ATP-binding protein
LAHYDLTLEKDGTVLVYTYDTRQERTGIRTLLNDMANAGLTMTDLQTQQSSLEDIFVGLVKDNS